MSDTDARIDFLRDQFEQLLASPRQTGDEDFHMRLQALQAWEIEDIRRRHALKAADSTQYETVLEYYLDNLHSGLDLQGAIDKGPGAIENARKMDKAYQVFANSIEYSVLSARLEDSATECIGELPITHQIYADALRQSDDLDARLRRLDLLVDIGHEVAPHLRSRLIHTAFKLLKAIFRSSGMGGIHETLDEGFKRLRNVSRLTQILAEIAESERQQLKEIFSS